MILPGTLCVLADVKDAYGTIQVNRRVIANALGLGELVICVAVHGSNGRLRKMLGVRAIVTNNAEKYDVWKCA